MATTEHAAKISDVVTAELVECLPDPPAQTKPAQAESLEATPVQRAMRATLTQTGAEE